MRAALPALVLSVLALPPVSAQETTTRSVTVSGEGSASAAPDVATLRSSWRQRV